MADLNEQESEFSKLLRQAPLDDAPRPEHREALRLRVLSALDEAARVGPVRAGWNHLNIQGREIMRRPIPRLVAVAAASLLITAGWMLFPGHQSVAQAFNRIAHSITAATTARFQMEVQIEGQPKQKFQAYYMAPGRFRQEIGAIVNVSDFNAGKSITWMTNIKKATVMNRKPGKDRAGDKNQPSENFFEQLRELLSQKPDAAGPDYQALGEKEINGRRATGFRLVTPVYTTTLWGDPDSGAPVLVDAKFNGTPPAEVTISNFEINPALDPTLFDLKPPAGYQVQSLDVDGSKPGERDLIDGLRTFAELSGGDFPDELGLNPAGMGKLFAKLMEGKVARAGQKPSDAEMQKMMKDAMTIGRGFGFAIKLPASADAHYAGKGVKRDTPDRAIFWYKPEGATKYRVLYADLSIKDAGAAPTIAGAERIGGTSQQGNR